MKKLFPQKSIFLLPSRTCSHLKERVEQNLALCKRTENVGFDKNHRDSQGRGGWSVWVVFPVENTTLSSSSGTDGIFVPPQGLQQCRVQAVPIQSRRRSSPSFLSSPKHSFLEADSLPVLPQGEPEGWRQPKKPSGSSSAVICLSGLG